MLLRRSVAVLAAVVSTGAVSACGFDVDTNRIYTPGVGTNERSSDVDVLHGVIVSGEDGSGTLVAGLANNDQSTADTLTDVAGPTVTTDVSSIEIPAGGFTQLVDDPVTIEGEGVSLGKFVEVTFVFENAEAVTLDVPVVAAEAEFADVPLP